MYPWLEKYSRQASLKAGLEEHAAMETDKDSVELPLLGEEVLLETWALPETRRQEWADEEVVRTPDFETFIRGGAHVQATFGIPYDCIISRPCSEVARSWVQGYIATDSRVRLQKVRRAGGTHVGHRVVPQDAVPLRPFRR